MSNDEDALYLDDTEDNDLPKTLRAKIKELSRKNSDLEVENDTLKGESRSRILSETLSAKGLNPKIAAFIPKDLDGDAIDAWLDEYGEVFGGGQKADTKQTVIARDSEQAASIRQMADAEQGASAPGLQSILAGVEQAQNMDELMAALRSA